MWIGALKIELFISDSHSLKHKRMIVRAMKDSLAHNFNVSVAEVNEQDKWQKAVVGIAAVGPNKQVVNSVLDKVLDSISRNGSAHIVNVEREVL